MELEKIKERIKEGKRKKEGKEKRKVKEEGNWRKLG